MQIFSKMLLAGFFFLSFTIGCVPPPRQVASFPTTPTMDLQEMKRYHAEEYCRYRDNWCRAILTPQGKRYNLAVELYEKYDLDTAYEILKPNLSSGGPIYTGVEPDSSFSPSLNLAGIIYWKLGNKEVAREYFIRAARLDDTEAKENLEKLRIMDTATFSYRKKALKIVESLFSSYGGGSDLSIDVHVK